MFIEVPYDEYTLTLAGPHAATSSSVGVVVGKAQPVHAGINLISRLSSGTAAASGAAAVRPVLAESAAEMPRPASAVQPSRPPIVQATTPATPPAALPRAASANSRRDGWVQLGAFGSRENAQRHLDGLIRQGALVSAETDIRVDGSGPRAGLHRVLASKDGASAQAFCQSLKGRGVQCVTASP